MRTLICFVILTLSLTSRAELTHDAARKAAAEKATELAPLILKQALKTGDFEYIVALGPTTPEKDQAAYATQLMAGIEAKPSPTRLAIYELLGRWHIALTDKQFTRAIHDKSTGVQHSVVNQFILTRTKLTTKQQIERYKACFSIPSDPYRLDAMDAFAMMTLEELTAMKPAVDKNFRAQCAKETEKQMKAGCELVIKKVGG